MQQGGAGPWQAARLDQDLFAGDAVKTGPVSRAAILGVDESQIKLNENTVFVLKSAFASPRLHLGGAVPAAAAEPAASQYQVPQGEVWLKNSNEKFRFEMETPAVVAAIRGTEFDLRVQTDGTSRLVLLAGALSLVNPYGQVTLQPGEEGMARPGQAPTKRVLLQPTDAVQWSLFYPGIFSYRDLPLSPAAGEARAPGGPPPVAAPWREAEGLYDRGQLQEARAQAEVALGRDPENSRALTLLGWCSLQTQDPEKAQEYFRRVKQWDDRAVVGLALARYRLGDAVGAYRCVKEGIQKIGSTPLLLTFAGYFALQVGRVEEARGYLESACRQAPDLVLPAAFMAQVNLVQNRREVARTEAARLLAAHRQSPLAQLTMALTDIAAFELPAARKHLEEAIAADPSFVDAYVCLAKIWLGSDYLDRAWRVVEQALRLAPAEGEVLALAGFVRLGYRDYQGAKEFFDRAVKVSPGLGEPFLGLGHYYFRYRQPDRALAAILTATLLEPRIAIYQSNLGKALYQVRAFDKALETYDYAKTLDPKDPTPYFYKGIALTDLNRPGEAIQEINRSIELNDNRAIFRGRLSLDRDLAVRNVNLARSYNQLGLSEWATSKAVTSVKYDPLNGSTHLFLAHAYLADPQRVTAASTEVLLYQILSPANQNTFSQGNDYTPMFEVPYYRVLAQGGIGAWQEQRTIQDHSLEVYGGIPGLAFDARGAYTNDRGFREQNEDHTRWFFDGTVKWEPTVKHDITAFASYYDLKEGDTSNLNDWTYANSSHQRHAAHQPNYQISYAYRFNPQYLFLAYLNYTRLEDNYLDYPYDVTNLDFFGFPATYTHTLSEILNPQESLNVQLQNYLILGDHTFIAGFSYLNAHLKYRSLDQYLFSLPFFNFTRLDSLWQHLRQPNRARTAYLFDYWRLAPGLLAELGLFYDTARVSQAPVGQQSLSNSGWSPLVGLNWEINKQHTLRLAAQSNLTSNVLAVNLAPADVASFPREINAFPGSVVRQAGLSWETQWGPKTFSVVRLDGTRIATPTFRSGFFGDQEVDFRAYHLWKRYMATATFNRILTPAWGLVLGAEGKRFVPDSSREMQFIGAKDFSEADANLGLFFRYPSGLLGGINTFLVYQNVKDRTDPTFGLVDLTLGYEFPGKRGQATVAVTNLFNRHFYYQEDLLSLERFFPARQITFTLALYF